MRCLFVSSLVLIVTGCTLAADDSSSIKHRVQIARAAYEKSIEQARKDLLAVLEQKEEVARKAGDLAQVRRVRNEREAFAEERELPKVVSVNEYRTAVAKAQAKLEAVYIQARKEYTQAGQIDAAEVVESDLLQLTTKRPLAVSASAKVAPLKASFREKSLWIGTLQLSIEPRPRNTIFIVTDLKGKHFKALHVWDDIASPMRDWDEVEGDIDGARLTLNKLFREENAWIGRHQGETLTFTTKRPNGTVCEMKLRFRK